jgi:hypothetical protein
MPQLPSGRHIAFDPSPLRTLIEAASRGSSVHVLMAIEAYADLFSHIDILYWRPKTPDGETRSLTADSAPAPAGLEPYPSGYNLLTIRGPYNEWSQDDQEAFIAYLDDPGTAAYLLELLGIVKKSQAELLAAPATPGGLLAHMWKTNCHPLQENGKP